MREMLTIVDELGRDGSQVRAGEVIAEAIRRVPLEDEERVLVASGRPRGEVNARWSSRELVEAGWLMKDPKGTSWTIPPAGRQALIDLPTVPEFANEARRLSNEWRTNRENVRADQLSSVILPLNEDQARTLDAAQLFVERGLKQGTSVFAPSRSVWAAGPVAELVEHFIGAKGATGVSFIDNLANQLATVSDEARLLMAELITWQFLPISNRVLGERKKSERVNFVLGLMSEPVPVPVEVRRAFTGGSFNPGPAMSNGIPGALHIMLRLLEAWLALPLEEQEQALEEPHHWRDLVMAADGHKFPSQRNALLYLVHPAHFGPIVSEAHKLRIRSAFMAEIENPTDDIEEDIYNITIALQEKGGGPAQYYEAPLKTMWFEDSGPALGEEAYDLEEEGIPPVGQSPVFDGILRKTDKELSGTLSLDAQWLDDSIGLLERQKQIVLYGPPGTGKTYIARELGKHISGGAKNIDIVQFHPSYSYEDFFEGYRPSVGSEGGLTFTLRPGPLRRIAERAAANPEYPYVLVIDEINRGNLSKIFGELYYLLEYRDDEISLLYGHVDEQTGEARKFSLPSNLFIIGTMNTSDRSIALLDAAMRRRFAFCELHPEKAPVREFLASWAKKQSDENGFLARLAPLLEALNGRIRDDAFKIGPSYLLKARSDADLDKVWESQILPLLAELHFGENADLEQMYGLASLRAETAKAAPAADEPTIV